MKEVADYCLYDGNAAYNNNITVSELPSTLEYIGTQSFMNCKNISINIFGGPDSALKYIGPYAFSFAGTTNTELKSIYIHKGVELG